MTTGMDVNNKTFNVLLEREMINGLISSQLGSLERTVSFPVGTEIQSRPKLIRIKSELAEMHTTAAILARTCTDSMPHFSGRMHLLSSRRNRSQILTIISSATFLASGHSGWRLTSRLSMRPRFRQPNDVIHCLRDLLASCFRISFSEFLGSVIEWWKSGQNVYRWWGSCSKYFYRVTYTNQQQIKLRHKLSAVISTPYITFLLSWHTICLRPWLLKILLISWKLKMM